MKEKIKGVIESINGRDNLNGPGITDPRHLSDEAIAKVKSLLPLGKEAVPILTDLGKNFYIEMLRLAEEEKKPKKQAKPGLVERLFGKKAAAAPPSFSSWDRRTQVKAVIRGLEEFFKDECNRAPEAVELLVRFSQTSHFDVFDDARRVLKALNITEKDLWKMMLQSLPVVQAQAGDMPRTMDDILRQLDNTSGFQMVTRRKAGDHFDFASTYTHNHIVFRTGEASYVMRIIPMS